MRKKAHPETTKCRQVLEEALFLLKKFCTNEGGTQLKKYLRGGTLVEV